MISVRAGAASDVGRVRALNEDAALAVAPAFVVADGMGGHSAGEVASGIVVHAFGRVVGRDDLTPSEVSILLADANREVVERGAGTAEFGMGTTAAGVVLVRNGGHSALLVFNVGDSRVYRLSGGRLEQLSVDHSYVQDLIDSGSLAADQARDHPRRNVVTRAIGIDPSIEPDFWLIEPAEGDRFIICSDGLHGEVLDDAIGAVAASEPDPQQAADELVARALAAGGRDNVTVVVLDVAAILDDVDAPLDITGPPALALVEVPGVQSVDPGDVPTTQVAIVDVPLVAEPEASDASGDLIDRIPDFAPAADGAPVEDADPDVDVDDVARHDMEEEG